MHFQNVFTGSLIYIKNIYINKHFHSFSLALRFFFMTFPLVLCYRIFLIKYLMKCMKAAITKTFYIFQQCKMCINLHHCRNPDKCLQTHYSSTSVQFFFFLKKRDNIELYIVTTNVLFKINASFIHES